MDTEVVYVASPDFGPFLFASLGTLLATSSTFDRVRIFCVGQQPSDWTFRDDRIIVEEVEPLSDFFLLNKTYLTRSPAERVVFLDTDTLVVDALDGFWSDSTAEVIARKNPVPPNGLKRYDERLEALNARPIPYLNTGVLVFQNGAHQALADVWPPLIEQERNADSLVHGPRFAEQVAFSQAVAVTDLSLEIVGREKHGYAWGSDPPEDTIVYHTGSRNFYSRIAPVLWSRKARLSLCSRRPWGWSTRHLLGQLAYMKGRQLKHRLIGAITNR